MERLDVNLDPETAARVETVELGGHTFQAFPRGRHAARMERPRRLTIAIPAQDAAGTIAHAIESLAGQTSQDFDVIVVDDASGDATFARACRAAAQRENVTVYRLAKAMGRVPTWNRCLVLARGELVKILPPNTFLDHDFVARMGSVMSADRAVVLARCAHVELRPDGAPPRSHGYFPESRTMTGANAFLHGLLVDDLVGDPSTHVMRRRALEDHGLRFDERMPGTATFALALRLFAHGDFAYVHAPLAAIDGVADRDLRGPSDILREGCRARLEAARSWPTPIPPESMVALGQRLGALFGAVRAASADSEAVSLGRIYAGAMRELATVLEGRLAADADRALGTDATKALIKEAEAEANAGRPREAEAILLGLLARAPWTAEALNDFGVLRFQAGDAIVARKCFEAALECDASYAQARDNLDALAAQLPVAA